MNTLPINGTPSRCCRCGDEKNNRLRLWCCFCDGVVAYLRGFGYTVEQIVAMGESDGSVDPVLGWKRPRMVRVPDHKTDAYYYDIVRHRKKYGILAKRGVA